jgi:hypothetical protein
MISPQVRNGYAHPYKSEPAGNQERQRLGQLKIATVV